MARPRATSQAAVLRAAATVFQELGYEAATIDDIAHAAGISKPTVYQYAKSKQWLLDRIVENLWREMYDAAETIYRSEEPANSRLFRIVRMHIDFAVQYRAYQRVTMTEEVALSTKTRKFSRERQHATTERMTALLGECRTDGTLHPDADPATTARLLLSLLSSLYRWYHPTPQLTEPDLALQVIRLISGAVEPPEKPWDRFDVPTPSLATSPLHQPS